LAPFSVVEHDPPLERPDAEYPFLLTTGRRLDSYNTGVQTGGFTSPLRRGETLDISPEDAERVLRAADTKEAPATAPAAELALADLLIGSRRAQQAVTLLEHLILTYPQSALVPQARRKLDEARGAVPKT
jgi:predicted molibdopterin-dependent oxidoreductase YjgC